MRKKRRSKSILAALAIALAVIAGFFLPTAINALADRSIEEIPQLADLSIVDISSGTGMTMIQRLRLLMSYNSINVSVGSVYDLESARDKILEEVETIAPDSSWRDVLQECGYDGMCLLYVQSDDPSVSMIAWNMTFYLDDDYGSSFHFVLDEETGKILSVSVYAETYEEYMDKMGIEMPYNPETETDTGLSSHTLCQKYADYLGVELMELYQENDYGDSWLVVLVAEEDYIEIPLYYFWSYGFSIGP